VRVSDGRSRGLIDRDQLASSIKLLRTSGKSRIRRDRLHHHWYREGSAHLGGPSGLARLFRST
jgi:hypothetical protein